MDRQEMQEKLKNMSPEEIMALQKQNCIFCHISSGKVPSRKIHEDEKCIAILDINPANPGHILLLPKEHYMIMPQVPEEIMAHLAIIAKQLSSSCLKAFKCDGTNIFIANGPAAGQKAQHFMIHIIPRFDNDGVGIELSENYADEKDLQKVHDTLVRRVNEIFGIRGQETPERDKIADEIEDLIDETEEAKKELSEVLENEKINHLDSGKEKTKKPAGLGSKKGTSKATKKVQSNKKDINLDDINRLFG